MAAAVDQEEKDAADGWQIVRSARPADSVKKTGSVGGDIREKGSLLSNANYHHLIGCAIRKDDTDKSEIGVTRESEMRSRIGGILKLPPGAGLPLKGTPHQERLDLGNTSEWPSMGWEKDTIPQLTSWNAVVKKPPMPKQNREEVRSVKCVEQMLRL